MPDRPAVPAPSSALDLAYEDMEADSGNHDPLDAFLDANFTEDEVGKLAEAADRLGDRAWKSLQRRRAGAGS